MSDHKMVHGSHPYVSTEIVVHGSHPYDSTKKKKKKSKQLTSYVSTEIMVNGSHPYVSTEMLVLKMFALN